MNIDQDPWRTDSIRSDKFVNIDLYDDASVVPRVKSAFENNKDYLSDFNTAPEGRDSLEVVYAFSVATNVDATELFITKNKTIGIAKQIFPAIRKTERNKVTGTTREKANAIGSWILQASKYTQNPVFLSEDVTALQDLHKQRGYGEWLLDLVLGSYLCFGGIFASDAQKAMNLCEKIDVSSEGSTRPPSENSYDDEYLGEEFS